MGRYEITSSTYLDWDQNVLFVFTHLKCPSFRGRDHVTSIWGRSLIQQIKNRPTGPEGVGGGLSLSITEQLETGQPLQWDQSTYLENLWFISLVPWYGLPSLLRLDITWAEPREYSWQDEKGSFFTVHARWQLCPVTNWRHLRSSQINSAVTRVCYESFSFLRITV
jgi:hypothetical protein